MLIDVLLFTTSVAKPYANFFWLMIMGFLSARAKALVDVYLMECECDPPWVSSPLPLSHCFGRFLCSLFS